MPQGNTEALRGLIEVTRLARSGGSLSTRLERLAGTIGDSLGYATVVITLYRPAWDDFRISAVSGRDEARRVLLGCTRSWDDYRPLLDDRFFRRGAYVIPDGSYDWSNAGATYTPPVEPTGDGPDAWNPEDVLLVPLKGSNGELLGMMSVDEPRSMRRPTDHDLDLLAAVGDHVALAIEEAQADAVAARHRASLQHLLHVSARLTETIDADDILVGVCDGIRRALGFQRVSIELLGALDGGGFTPRASAGWGPEGAPRSGLTTATFTPLLDPAFEIEGCYLLPTEVARARVSPANTWTSTMNGRGPRAWQHHWLVVPLHDRDGALVGFIWVDDPADRLLPSQEKLQALRLFANQAMTALDAAARFRELQFLADHDALTRLANRRAFVRQLDAETARAHRYGHGFTLVLCDIDDFKQLNDRAGHLVGDDHLIRFACQLAESIRRADFAFRIGGDEFALILVETGEADACHVVERLAERLETDVTAGIRASFGVAAYDGEGGADELFRRADEAMYLAKRSEQSVAVAA